jgi:hypothetical protein
MFTQEAFDEGRINVREFFLFSLKPETEMGKATQIDSDGALGIALVSQCLNVICNDALERAISQPVAANKTRKDCIGGHGLLL